MIEVKKIGTPGPAAYLDACCRADVLESPIALVAIERVPPRMPAVKLADSLRALLVKNLLLRDALPGCGPHIGDIQVRFAIVVVISPGRAHTRTHVLNVCHSRDSLEGSVPTISVEIVAAKVIHHVQVWRAGRGRFSPCACEAVAIVLSIQTSGCRPIEKGSITFVVKQEVGRPITRVKVRRWIVILIQAEIVTVKTEINVEFTVTVVVGDGCMGEGALRRARKAERVSLACEGAVAAVEKEERSSAAHHKKVLQAVVAEVRKERAGGVVQHADAGLFRHIFKGAITLIAVQPVRQTGRLAYVQVIKAVAIVISRGHAIVAVDVDAARPIQLRAPLIGTAQQLFTVRRSPAQRLLGDIEIGRTLRDAAFLLHCLPASQLPVDCVGGRHPTPVHHPRSDALFPEISCPGGDDAVANTGPHSERLIGERFDRGDFEFDCLHVGVRR